MRRMKVKRSLYKSQVTQVTWLFILISAQFLITPVVDAQIYKWTDENGQVHYGDKKPDTETGNTKALPNIEEVELKVYKPKPDPEIVLKDVEANAAENTKVIKWSPSNTNKSQEAKPKQKRLIKKRGNLVMFSTKVCGYCKKARAYFKSNNIRYHEIDINASSKNNKRFKKEGGRGVPYFVMNSRKKSGWSEKGFEQFYYKNR